MTLLRQQWKTDRASLLGWAAATALMTWYLAAAFRMLANTGVMTELTRALETLPPALKALIASGEPIFTMQGWVEGVLYSGVIPLVLLIFTGLYVAGLITREMDQHTMEFLLSLPVERSRILLSRWLGLVGNLAVLSLVHWGVTVLVVGAEARPLAYLWADINLFLALTATGTLLLLVSLFIDDYPRGVAVMEGIALGLFFAGSVLEGNREPKEWLRSVLPLHYFNPSAIISGGGFPWRDAAVLAAASLILLALAVWQFRRKQIAA